MLETSSITDACPHKICQKWAEAEIAKTSFETSPHILTGVSAAPMKHKRATIGDCHVLDLCHTWLAFAKHLPHFKRFQKSSQVRGWYLSLAAKFVCSQYQCGEGAVSAKRDGETTRDLETSWNTRETRENTEEPKYACCQMKENTANS